MLLPDNAILVSDIAGRRAVLELDLARTFPLQLQQLGFRSDNDKLVRPIADEADRLTLIRRLIELNALFVGGAGWSPSELVAYYRQKGQIIGSYKEVVWRNPESFEVIEH